MEIPVTPHVKRNSWNVHLSGSQSEFKISDRSHSITLFKPPTHPRHPEIASGCQKRGSRAACSLE